MKNRTVFICLFLFLSKAMAESPRGYDEPNRPVDGVAAQRGWTALSTGIFIRSWMNKDILNNLWRSWGSYDRKSAKDASDEERKQMIWKRYGFVEAPYDNAGLPIGHVWSDAKKNQVAFNCLICHGGRILGQTIIGSPNARLNYHNFMDDLPITKKILGIKTNLVERIRNVPVLSAILDPILFPGAFKGPSNIFRGTADSGILNLFAFRSIDLGMTAIPTYMGDISSVPVDPPPWWNVWKKKKLYYRALVDFGHRPNMQFAMDYSSDAKAFQGLEEYFKDITAWIDSLRPSDVPQFPGLIKTDAAVRGHILFKNNCVSCHGLHDTDQWTFPGKRIPVEVIETDDKYIYHGFTDQYMDRYFKSWYNNYEGTPAGYSHEETRGYVPPPLDRIWASPPYFHNGSIPTLYHVLFPEERPKVWTVPDYDQYDFDRVGFKVRESNGVPFPAPLSRVLRREYYDTTQYGASNKGHEFMLRSLSRIERLDILEYLKTL